MKLAFKFFTPNPAVKKEEKLVFAQFFGARWSKNRSKSVS